MNAEETVHVITGATSGIGRALGKRMAAGGGTIVLVGRDAVRAEAARAEIAHAAPTARVEVRLADLASGASVRALARELLATHPQIASLVNCAAVFSSRRIETADGLELMFATNHLAPFLLTNLLLAPLQSAGAGRIVTVTAPSSVKLDFDDLQGARRFRALTAFGASKAANLLFTFELSRRIAGSGVTANAVHPGLARTGLMRQAPALLRAPVALLSAPPDRAAERIAPLVLDERYRSATGQFFHRGRAIDPPPYTQDTDVQRRLWDVSAQLTGLG